jgi:FkbM family methyltransferase
VKIRNRTLAEWRTIVTTRIFVGTRLLNMISDMKWTVYPLLVRFIPRLAILIHEPESARVFWRAIRPGMTVVDAGANRGGFSMLAARRAGTEGRVFAFEPEPDNFRRLRERLRRYPNVIPVAEAIAARSGEMSLRLDDFHAGHSLYHNVGGGAAIMVPVTSLDDFVAEHQLPGIDVIKLDIEGAEVDALAGMSQTLSRTGRKPVIVCEVHAPNRPEDFIEKLRPYAYTCTLLDAELTGTTHEVPVHVLAVPIA